MNGFEIDWAREERTGTAEAILCDGKTAGQIAAMLEAAAGRRLLLTRLSAEKRAALPQPLADALDYDPLSRTALSGEPQALRDGGIGIVCAGTSDLPVAGEVRRTLAFHGLDAPVIADVGVAGLWRLMDKLERIRGFRVLIAVAGMEGALFSVLAGLVRAPVIAVPTSVGYGVAEGGRAALSTALATCAPGVVTVNIDNGFGAACAAIRMTASAACAGDRADIG